MLLHVISGSHGKYPTEGYPNPIISAVTTNRSSSNPYPSSHQWAAIHAAPPFMAAIQWVRKLNGSTVHGCMKESKVPALCFRTEPGCRHFFALKSLQCCANIYCKSVKSLFSKTVGRIGVKEFYKTVLLTYGDPPLDFWSKVTHCG